jgi:hypothetical protein
MRREISGSRKKRTIYLPGLSIGSYKTYRNRYLMEREDGRGEKIKR